MAVRAIGLVGVGGELGAKVDVARSGVAFDGAPDGLAQAASRPPSPSSPTRRRNRRSGGGRGATRSLYSALVPVVSVVDILRELSACPTAPLHEAYVARRIVALCREYGLPVTADHYGNLYARTGEGHTAAKAGSVPLVFCAHMDHPAFEVISAKPPTALLLGGVPAECFSRPVRARIVRPDGELAVRIVGHEEVEDGRRELRLGTQEALAPGDFGVFDVGPFRETGDLLFGPAMDDLAGCAATLAALIECRSLGIGTDTVGLFTRAEEVGLTGATLVARERPLPAASLVVSLEASRALPGATMGDGPVIRVGDRSGSFAPSGEALLRRAAERLSAEGVVGGPVAVQRQLMPGGTCEATAFTTFGYAATGVAFPLGNYHNASPEGTIAPEYIHRRDLEGGVRLLVAAVQVAGEPAADDPVRSRLTSRADGLAARLRQTSTEWLLG